jgi:adenine-specific DNA methylase
LASERLGRDVLLVVADLDPVYGKTFRNPTEAEVEAADSAITALRHESRFTPTMPAIPDETIPLNNGATIRPQLYGAVTYGDLMCDRQTLSFIRLARVISTIGSELMTSGFSRDYSRALTGYAASAVIKQLRYSTRGAWLRARDKGTVEVAGIYVNESTVGFSYDFLETSPYEGPGTWNSVASQVLTSLTSLFEGMRPESTSTSVDRGSAVALRFRNESVQSVVTDPPYDAMVYYSDSSDLFYAWLKRCLISTFPEMTITADPRGIQEKTDEIIVKEHGKSPGEHRDRVHYDTMITRAFSEMRRVVRSDGVVTIVFGHGEPEVWKRLLESISHAGLVMTASWPANTESGGQQGKANIETTLTMACRPAPSNRRSGRKGAVEAEIKAEVRERYPEWERWGLAPADMLMAAAGPAMEVVGRYESVLDATGEPVGIHTFLPLARAAVQDAMAVEVDHHPLETFDARTRFALWWVRLYGRQTQAKSELRWQALASSMEIADVRDLIPDADKGVAFTTARRFDKHITTEAAVVDVALALAAASEEGLARMGEVLAASGRSPDDPYLWAAVKFLADRLPDSDPDAIALTRVLRTRDGISTAAKTIATNEVIRRQDKQLDDAQLRLL